MNLKNHTIIELTNELNSLNRQITTLKDGLAANTQAVGFNTIAVEGITEGLKELAKETGAWREDDKHHHKEEKNLDEEKVRVMKELKSLFEADPKTGVKRTC